MERQAYRGEMAQKEQKTRDEVKQYPVGSAEYNRLMEKADKQQHDMVIFDSITGAIYGPNSNGVTGYVARAAAPELSYRIGQYYKGNAELNKIDGGNRNEEGSAPHILAHGILAAAVSYATGNDVTTGALSAMGSEAGAKYVSRYLYQTDDPSKLTAEQKQTVSSITGLAGLAVGATTGSVTNAVNAAETGKVAVQDNIDEHITKAEQQERVQILYEQACNGLGMSSSNPACGDMVRHLGYEYVKAVIVPDSIFELIPIGKGFGLLLKGTKKVYGLYKDEESARRAVKEAKAVCTGGVCFTAGTLVETSEGLKPIETFVGGELIWSRNDVTLEYGYRPVIATKRTENQAIFKVTVKDSKGDLETLETTAEHPFWIKDCGWLKAALLDAGMILLDRNNEELEVVSQYLVPNRLETVYNIEVEGFHTYHVGKLGTWVHNANCCTDNKLIETLSQPLSKGTTDHLLNNHSYNRVKQQIDVQVNKLGRTKEEAFNRASKENNSFFNKNWSEETILAATEYAKQDAIKNNITSGLHSVTYRGEKITISISNEGKVSTAYGHHKYTHNDF